MYLILLVFIYKNWALNPHFVCIFTTFLKPGSSEWKILQKMMFKFELRKWSQKMSKSPFLGNACYCTVAFVAGPIFTFLYITIFSNILICKAWLYTI